jgi:hypothetical protein
MTNLDDGEALELLRRAMRTETAPLSADLWPRVRERIDRGAVAPPVADWLLVAALALLCLLQPSLIGIVLLHF